MKSLQDEEYELDVKTTNSGWQNTTTGLIAHKPTTTCWMEKTTCGLEKSYTNNSHNNS